jgi:hypothetical protein
MSSLSSKRDNHRICFGFSYVPTVGPYKGKRLNVGPGEPVPDEILKNEDMLNRLIQAQKISVKGPSGDYEVSKKVITLTDGQIEMLLRAGNDSDLKKMLLNPHVSRESLIRLHTEAEKRKLPKATLAKIESASMR